MMPGQRGPLTSTHKAPFIPGVLRPASALCPGDVRAAPWGTTMSPGQDGQNPPNRFWARPDAWGARCHPGGGLGEGVWGRAPPYPSPHGRSPTISAKMQPKLQMSTAVE